MRKLILLLLLFFNSPLVFSGEVISNVRGQILINTYGEKYKLNQKLYIYNPETQRRIGVVKVMQKRRRQEAIMAKLLNGKAIPGALVESAERNIANDDGQDIRSHRTRTNELNRRTRRENSGTLKIKHGIGLYLINSQLSVRTSYANINMNGTGLGVDYSFQIPLYTQTSFRGNIGIHPVKLSSSSSGGDNNNFDVTYLSLVGLGKHIFKPNQTGTWIAGGAGFLMPTSKSSSVLDSNSISTNYSINLAIGTDIVSNKQLTSLSFEYAIFPTANTQTTSTAFTQMLFGFSFFFK